MASLATTKMSSKGQVVIPEDIRKRLGLEAGAQFIVVGDKDVVILKAINQPSIKDFKNLIAKARNQAKEAGLQPEDIQQVIDEVRSEG
jgi:AbrB family looped-hinge helix DNA binding protein